MLSDEKIREKVAQAVCASRGGKWDDIAEMARDSWRLDATVLRSLLAASGLVVLDLAELEAALKPFAKFADALKDEVPDNIALGLYAGGDIRFGPDSASVGDLRRAAALLAAITEEKKG